MWAIALSRVGGMVRKCTMRTCAIHFYSVMFLWLLMTRDKKNGREHAVFTLSSSCSDSLPTLSWLSGVSRPVPLSLENLSPKSVQSETKTDGCQKAVRVRFTPCALAGGQGGKCPKRVRPSISRTQYPEMSDQFRSVWPRGKRYESDVNHSRADLDDWFFSILSCS